MKKLSGFKARYSGTCSVCKNKIKPGDLIDYTGTVLAGKRQAHVDCVNKAEDRTN